MPEEPAPTNKPAVPAIYARRMIRNYTDQAVPPSAVDAILNAATRAPSPHNRQPWRFAVVTGERRVALAQAMGDQLRSDLQRDGVPIDVIERDTARSYRRITSAPVSIVACLSMRDMDVYPDQRRNDSEHWMAGQAVAAAVQNMLLTATALGIGACWMCAPLFCQPTVRQALDLPEDWEPQALVTLGYPADDGKERGRQAAKSLTLFVSDSAT